MAIVVDNKFEFGQMVYLITDEDQKPRMVFGIEVYKESILYKLACGTQMSCHYDFEISEESKVFIK